MVIAAPGESDPARKLAPFTTAVMVGRGTVTVMLTLMGAVPVAPLPPATVMVPVYVPALVSAVGTTETVNAPGAVPEMSRHPRRNEATRDEIVRAS